MKFYGQHGEDAIAWKAFEKDKELGMYIDIGAMDGLRFSNTYAFELAGWQGMCVEAHPYYYEIAKRNRPKAIVIHAAVSDTDNATVNFNANRYGSFSTLDKSLEGYFKSYGFVFNGFETIQVPQKTIRTLLRENGVQKVDFVSIDIEGTELSALRGIGIETCMPRVIVVEAFNTPRHKLIADYLCQFGYTTTRIVGNNYFFTHREIDAQAIRSAHVDQNSLVHTLHPMSEELQKKAAAHKAKGK
jgi:FkbM family methyltransferase